MKNNNVTENVFTRQARNKAKALRNYRIRLVIKLICKVGIAVGFVLVFAACACEDLDKIFQLALYGLSMLFVGIGIYAVIERIETKMERERQLKRARTVSAMQVLEDTYIGKHYRCVK